MNMTFIAVDLGAGSGRVIAASTDLRVLALEEVHRFDNPGLDLPGGSFWNVTALYQEILIGLRRAVEQYGESIVSIGIDTWGCDFALVDKDGELLGLPHQYRDPRFEGMAEIIHLRISEAEVFATTGIRTNFYNSSLHLLAAARRGSAALENAANLLFMPDLLAYWLTGVQAVERTVASTSQLLDVNTGDWARGVIGALGLPGGIFGKIVPAGTILGPVRRAVADAIGRGGIPVVAVASHDTAAAVAGIPLEARGALWLSSGTWSIMGVELDKPITSLRALGYGFCNELGIDDTVRFLKNIAGLWLIQECRRQWSLDAESLSYQEMASLSDEAPGFTAFIDPDDPCFAIPGDMPRKIRDWCARTGQSVPETKGRILRVATESIALKYRLVFERIKELTGLEFETLHAGGGGIQNASLSQATASALGIKVVAGPVEATSCGNVLTQMLGTGHLESVSAGRELIARSFEGRIFLPENTADWNSAYQRFLRLLHTC